MTKTELEAENAILKDTNRALGEQDQKLREDFCRALGFITYENDYGTRKEKVVEKTWAQIFVEIGRLKADRHMIELADTVSRHEQEIQRLDGSVGQVFDRLSNLVKEK